MDLFSNFLTENVLADDLSEICLDLLCKWGRKYRNVFAEALKDMNTLNMLLEGIGTVGRRYPSNDIHLSVDKKAKEFLLFIISLTKRNVILLLKDHKELSEDIARLL